MEVYFRPITEADIESLRPRGLLDSLDSCFSIPVLDSSLELEKKDAIFSGSEVGVSSEVVKEEEEEEKPMEIDSVGGLSTAETSTLPIPEVKEEDANEDESSSMNWVLGSKHRAILTTLRPTKKRKLLGSDAGLDQLLILPHSEQGSARCHVCCLGESGGKSNKIISCSSCGALVHKKCYGILEAVVEKWVCSWCKHVEETWDDKRGNEGLRPCILCPKEGGALKPVGGDLNNEGKKKFAHLFCSLWTPHVYVEDTKTMEPVVNIVDVTEMKTKMVCNVCKVKHGVCVRCSSGTCRTAFHPYCAREARHLMEIWGKFGCDNVELRAFCSKHSTSQDVDSVLRTRNVTRTAGDDFLGAKPPSATVLPNKPLKLRLSCKVKEENVTQAEVASSISSEVIKNEATTEEDGSSMNLSAENGDMQSSKNIDFEVNEAENSLSDSPTLIPFVKKLIAQGEYVVGDIASAIGISPDSLETALMGEISSFPSDLRPKIAKWFQGNAYVSAGIRHLKFWNGSAISSGSLAARVDCPKVANASGLDTPDNIIVPDPENADAHSVKSMLSHKRAKNSNGVLKKDKLVVTSEEKIQPDSNEELVDEIGQDTVVHTNDGAKDPAGNISPIVDQSQCKDQDRLKTLIEDACSLPSSGPLVLPPEVEGNLATVEKNELSETQHKPECATESVLSEKLDEDQANEIDVPQDGAVKKIRIDGSCSSYIHPYIQERLMEVQKSVLPELERREYKLNGQVKDRILSSNASDSCNQDLLSPVCKHVDHVPDHGQFDHLAQVNKIGMLELSPEDEVEGEMLYLQNKLLDSASAIKHGFDDLLGRVVQQLPHELEVLKKHRWDMVLVNQFLRDVKELKKRGRKERRHQEAQAVLAAAAAVAASSSRNPLPRKDGSDEIGFLPQSPQNVSGLPGRSGQPLPRSRLKEATRSAIIKVSPDKHSGGLQSPEFPKDNALSCDICRRPETLLNRIFVCSSCKVAVHLDCYRKFKDPVGPWKCELCEEMLHSGSPRNQTVENRDRSCLVIECGLCGGGYGAFRKATNGQWVHAFCAEWMLESTFRRGQQNLVDGMDVISKATDVLTCSICQQKFGICSKCSYGHCQVTFHPSCARAAGFYMNVKAVGGRLHHKAYCEKHSVEQRQKADTQHGAEELKGIKQIRFELEKVRILCERIVKREKIKRELVLCSHDILASRRDYVAYSALMRSSLCPPGISSESATTSIDNRSYSGIIQRKTDESSTSRPSFKRKAPDRTSYSGKQLPHRTQSVSFRNSTDDGEKRFKAKKQAETFHKEIVMTSLQASMQNQRLPKGFVYVPVGCLSKEKPVVDDPESHEPEEPGG
ncbi:uncharacterized protein LOC109849974 isoform X2 [Asparagus officinalis]|uniref:uncharacterized protein LOC109849974 isoform X2 n=1 Tax=Asparagus officinalis TaxID=4686 RepID=UPI00098DF2FF|nr:uncharacterized protein LOC109849974 isoform X2 [Asparagus officinalis]